MVFEELLSEFRLRSKDKTQKGRLFEKFTKKYFMTSRIFRGKFSEIWLWDEFPYRSHRDLGIDLVGKLKDEENAYAAIQCKFYDENETIYKHNIDSFISESGKSFNIGDNNIFFSERIIVTTAGLWSGNAETAIQNQRIPVTKHNLGDFLEDGSIDWQSFSINNIEDMRENKRKTIMPHQKEALSKVIEGFKENGRGKLIMACGTGKTFTSLKIAEEMYKNTNRGGVQCFISCPVHLSRFPEYKGVALSIG